MGGERCAIIQEPAGITPLESLPFPLTGPQPAGSLGKGRPPAAGSGALATGASLDAIANALGRASTDTTRIYAKIVDRMDENPARYLVALMGA